MVGHDADAVVLSGPACLDFSGIDVTVGGARDDMLLVQRDDLGGNVRPFVGEQFDAHGCQRDIPAEDGN